MAKVHIREGYKNQAWFDAHPTFVLKEGQRVSLLQTGKYKLGDGSTQLQYLVWQGDTPVFPVTSVNSKTGDVELDANDVGADASGSATAAQTAAESHADNVANTAEQNAKNYADTGDAATLSSSKAYTDAAIAGDFNYQGTWNGAGGLFPTTGGRGPSGAIAKGDAFEISIPVTIQGVEYDQGDIIISKIANPGQTVANWSSSEHNTQQATESMRGTAMVGTQAEIENEATTDDQKYVTLKKFWKGIARFIGLYLDTDGTLAANSDSKIPSQKAVKTYANTKENSANKDASGGYTGLTLFKINFKNAANTFTSFLTNLNTAARSYTFQDRNGTIADDTDLALKANVSEVEKVIQSQVNPGTTNSADTVERIIHSVLIPANTFTTNDILDIWFQIKRTLGSSSSFTPKVYVHTLNQLSGATQIALCTNFSFSSIIAAVSLIYGFISTTQVQRVSISASFSGDITGSTGQALANFNFNTAVDNYLIISTKSLTGTNPDTTSLGMCIIKKIKGV